MILRGLFIVSFKLIILTAFFGCGGSVGDAPKDLVEVTGIVTQDGKPVADALMLFTPMLAAAPSSGVTDSEGKYSLKYNDGRSGAASGEYNVSITVGGMSVAGADGGDGPPPEAPPEPKLYVLKSTVGQKATNINFELDEIPSNE